MGPIFFLTLFSAILVFCIYTLRRVNHIVWSTNNIYWRIKKEREVVEATCEECLGEMHKYNWDTITQLKLVRSQMDALRSEMENKLEQLNGD